MTNTIKSRLPALLGDMWCLLSAVVISLRDYDANAPLLMGIILIISIGNFGLVALFAPSLVQPMSVRRLFSAGCLALVSIAALASLREAVVFGLILLLLGWGFYFLPKRFNISVRTHGSNLWKQRMLIVLWLKYDVLSRYNQKILGILWIILLPLSTALILSLVFTEILQTKMTDVPFVSFFLTALTPWMVFSQSIFGSTVAILANMNLINAVPLPREVLVIKALGESLVDGLFVLLCMFLINLLMGVIPGTAILFLPFIIVIQILGMLGLMFFISAASVLVRDIPQFVSVIMQLLFYITPIVYPAEYVPQHLQLVLWLNPLSFLVTSYRMIILYNQPPDLATMYGAFVMALLIFTSGYIFFKANDQRFADYI